MWQVGILENLSTNDANRLLLYKVLVTIDYPTIDYPTAAYPAVGVCDRCLVVA